MKVDRPRPSLLWIVRSDFTSMCAVQLAAGLVLLFSLVAFFGPTQAGVSGSIMGALLTTLITLLVLIWRVRHIQAAFEFGEEVTGKLTEVSYYTPVADSRYFYVPPFFGRVGFTYVYGGMRYSARKFIYRTLKTAALVKGDEVSILVDRSEPRRAYIRDMFV